MVTYRTYGAFMLRKLSLLSLLVVKCFSLENDSDEFNEDFSIFEEKTYLSEDEKNLEECSQESMQSECCCFSDRCFYLEALPGYYYQMEKRIRDIYGTGGFSGQLDMGYFFFDKVACFLRGGAYWADGNSTVLGVSTDIVLANVTLGLKYVVPILNRLHYYVGGGARVFFLRIKNNTDFVQRRVSENKLGGAFVTGFWVYLSSRRPIFLDIFLDYSFYRFDFKSSIASERNNLNIKDPVVGIGLGYQF